MQRASLRLTLYGHRTQGYVAIRLLFSYPHVEVDCLFDLAVTGLQHPAFLAGGHAPGKSSSIRLFQLGIGLEAMVCGHGVVSSWEAVLPASRERERMATSDVVGKKNCRLEKYSAERCTHGVGIIKRLDDPPSYPRQYKLVAHAGRTSGRFILTGSRS